MDENKCLNDLKEKTGTFHISNDCYFVTFMIEFRKNSK